MVTGVPYDKTRKQLFKEKIKIQEDDAGGKERLRAAKFTVKGETKPSPIYRFQLDSLAYNKANGRIKSEVIEKEAELGRTLNQFDKADSNIIGNILLSIRRDENDKVKEDLRKNTQIYPGIITCDGIVINGNRRKALLSELYEETHDDKFKYLDAHILPSDITKSELWLIEAGIQLSAPQQLDYSPINHLLKLREGINAGLSIAAMESRIYGVSADKIKSDLDRLSLVDEYLSDFLGKEGKYYLVKYLDNHFINLVNILNFVRNPRGIKKDWIPTEDDLNELKLVAFYYIRMRMPHLRIRDLRDIFLLSYSWQECRRALSVDSNLAEEERERFKVEDTTSEDIDEDIEDSDVEESDSVTTASEERDIREETAWRENRRNELKSIFEDAREQKKLFEDSEKPLILVQRALKNIQAIPEKGDKLDDPEIDKVLSEIIQRINRIRKIIKVSLKN